MRANCIKLFFVAVSLFLSIVCARSQTVTFSRLNTNQFATNGLFATIKNGAYITNLNAQTSLLARKRFAMGVEYGTVLAWFPSQQIESDLYSWISIDSDSATPGARLITLIAGLDNGQLLVIKNNSTGTNTFRLENGSAVDGGGVVNLNGVHWDASPDQAMILVFDAFSGDWNEIGRFGTGTSAGVVANLTPNYVPYAVTTNILGDSPILRESSTNVYIPRITIGSTSNYFYAPWGVPTLGGRVDLYNTINGSIGINVDTFSPTNVANAVAAEFILFENGSGNRDISYGFYIENDVNSRGATLFGDPAGDGNTGAWVDSNAGGANSVGLIGNSRGSATNNIGVIARVMRQNSSTTTNIALLAEMERPGAYNPTQVGVYIAPTAVATTNLNPVSSMLLIDSLDTGYPTLYARSQGMTNLVIKDGKVHMLRGSDPTYGFTGSAYNLVSVNDVSLGDNSTPSWSLYSKNGSDYGGIELYANADSTPENSIYTTSSGGNNFTLRSGQNSGRSLFTMTTRNIETIALKPDVTSGTAFKLNTATNMTSGTLLTAQNNATNMFTVAASSGYTGAGTKYLSDDGTYKTLSAGDVVGPSSSITNHPGWNTNIYQFRPLAMFSDTTGKNIVNAYGTLSGTGSATNVMWGVDQYGTLVGATASDGVYNPYFYLSARLNDGTNAYHYSGVGTYNAANGNYADWAWGAVHGSSNMQYVAYLDPNQFRMNVYQGGNSIWGFEGTQQTVTKKGQVATPSYSFSSDTDTGMYSSAADTLNFGTGGILRGTFDSSGFTSSSALWANTFVSAGSYFTIGTTRLYQDAAGVFQMGADAATATAQTLKAHDGSGTDKNGANFTIAAGKPTGSGTGGIIYFATAGPGASGASLTTQTNRMEINGLGNITMNKPVSGNTLMVSGTLVYDTVYNSQASLTYAATTDLDFGGVGARSVDLTGNVTFTTSNRAGGRMLKVKILCDGTPRTFTWPSWKWVGSAAPASIAANKTMILSLECWGSNDSDIVAAYAVEQ